jgi:phage tail sheath gpL-like
MGETLPKLNFNILPADVEVGLAEQRILFIGQMTSEGTATAEKLVQNIANDNSWDTLFGKKISSC